MSKNSEITPSHKEKLQKIFRAKKVIIIIIRQLVIIVYVTDLPVWSHYLTDFPFKWYFFFFTFVHLGKAYIIINTKSIALMN